MNNAQTCPPNAEAMVESIRSLGYDLGIAIADIIDNSITAQATKIDIYAAPEPKMIVGILDDGNGMNDDELKEAMRMSTKDPDAQREAEDLGKFGLGLKTASFSHCKMLTVISKSSSSKISAKQWDIDAIIKTNAWGLNILDDNDLHELIIF